MKGELELPFAAGQVPRRSDAHDLPLIYIASPLTRAVQWIADNRALVDEWIAAALAAV